MSQSRKRRGRDTERMLAEHFRRNGFPYAEPVGSGSPGRDITGTGALAIEVKARKGLDLPAWMRQAAKNANDYQIPTLVLRLNGQGPESIDDFPVVLRLADFLWMTNELKEKL